MAKEETVAHAPEALVWTPGRVSPDAPLSRVVEMLRARPESRMVNVLDPEGRLVWAP